MNNDNSETVFVLQKVKEDPNYFYFISKHPSMLGKEVRVAS